MAYNEEEVMSLALKPEFKIRACCVSWLRVNIENERGPSRIVFGIRLSESSTAQEQQVLEIFTIWGGACLNVSTNVHL